MGRSMSTGAGHTLPDGLAPIRFPKTVLVQVGGRWHVIRHAREALGCLQSKFIATEGPSYKHAWDTCEAVARGAGAEGTQAAFIVASMEGGYPFEVYDDGWELDERLAAVAAENGLLDMLLELDGDPP